MKITTDLLMLFAFVAGCLIGLIVSYVKDMARISDYQERIEELNSIIFRDDKKK